ncbi:MAG: hypothetical protein JSR77_16120 [Planctomycetes bacterium]|nr:hypothetical protein [Planctomycetota bacterium]
MNIANQFAWAAAAVLTAANASLAQISGDSYVTREFSVLINESGGKAVTREFSLLINESGGKAVTREFTVIIGDRPGHATSREVSFELPVCNVGQSIPVITAQPQSQNLCCMRVDGACTSDATTLAVAAVTGGRTPYQWQAEALPGAWVTLVDGPNMLPVGQILVTGSNAAICTVGLAGVQPAIAGITFRCIVSNACGSVISDPATLAICTADFNCDGGTDGADLEAFFAEWEAGNPIADVNEDGGVDGADVDFFFVHWEGGC